MADPLDDRDQLVGPRLGLLGRVRGRSFPQQDGEAIVHDAGEICGPATTVRHTPDIVIS